MIPAQSPEAPYPRPSLDPLLRDASHRETLELLTAHHRFFPAWPALSCSQSQSSVPSPVAPLMLADEGTVWHLAGNAKRKTGNPQWVLWLRPSSRTSARKHRNTKTAHHLTAIHIVFGHRLWSWTGRARLSGTLLRSPSVAGGSSSPLLLLQVGLGRYLFYLTSPPSPAPPTIPVALPTCDSHRRRCNAPCLASQTAKRVARGIS